MSSFPFLRLPLEIRIKIYRLCLIERPFIEIDLNSPSPSQSSRHFSLEPRNIASFLHPEDVKDEEIRLKSTRGLHDHTPLDINANILLTCRTNYTEAIPILYGHNTFVFPTAPSSTSASYGIRGYKCWSVLLYFARRLTPLSRQSIQKIEIDFPIVEWEDGDGSSRIIGTSLSGFMMLPTFSNLRLLKVDLEEDIMARDIPLLASIQHCVPSTPQIQIAVGEIDSFDSSGDFDFRKVRISDEAFDQMKNRGWELRGKWESVGEGHEFHDEDRWIEWLQRSRLNAEAASRVIIREQLAMHQENQAVRQKNLAMRQKNTP
ncbi:MAG: hypothetical protein Q9178_000759 [Gyalolechia marmorata]